MALQLSYDSQYNVTFATAYVRITEVRVITPLNDADNTISVVTDVYADIDARDAGASPVGILTANGYFDESMSLSKTDIYNWLKTQPGFEGAIDV